MKLAQNKKKDHKNPNYIHNYHDEIKLYQGINKRNTYDTRHQKNAHREASRMDCCWMQLANAQCDMVSISIE